MTVAFLIDANLPAALAEPMESSGHEAAHVFDLGLRFELDRELWSDARSRRMVIVSKDADFADLSALDPTGPQVVWVRLGNIGKTNLLAIFSRVLPEVVRRLEAGERLIEVR